MNSTKFLDTKIINNKCEITTEVYHKTSRLPVDWLSKVPKQYNQNLVIGEFHRSKTISSNFEIEIKVMQCKFKNVDYPLKLSPLNNNLFIFPPDLFEENKPFILNKITYREENENASKYFIKKFEAFRLHLSG